MSGKFQIKSLIRDDGSRLDFEDEIMLSDDNQLLSTSEISTTATDFTEQDGGEMIRQRATPGEQVINGLIIPKLTDYWVLAGRVEKFFRINHCYKIIYERKDGDLFAVDGAWLSVMPSPSPPANEGFAAFTVTLTIGNNYRREYVDNGGFANTISLDLITSATGGEEWDDVGLVADDIGEAWEYGSGGLRQITVNSTRVIYPVWTVKGPCDHPKLQNNTTDSEAEFFGSVGEGQTLTVDFEAGTAYIDKAIATRMLIGSVSMRHGENLVGFDADGGKTETSTLAWNNILN